MTTSPPSPLGKQGELLACSHLEKLGYTILVRNYRGKLGEIDIVAEEGGAIIFIEVKTRRGTGFGHPFEAITARKQRQISKAALEYLTKHRLEDRLARFDVVSILFLSGSAQVDVLKNAFELCYP